MNRSHIEFIDEGIKTSMAFQFIEIIVYILFGRQF